VRTQALQQVSLVDIAVQKFTEEIEKAISELTQYLNQTVRELQELKAELSRETDTALEEMKRILIEDQPQLTSRLGSVFRALTEHFQPLQLFSYSLNTSPQALVTLRPQLHFPEPDTFICLLLWLEREWSYITSKLRTLRYIHY